MSMLCADQTLKANFLTSVVALHVGHTIKRQRLRSSRNKASIGRRLVRFGPKLRTYRCVLDVEVATGVYTAGYPIESHTSRNRVRSQRETLQ